MFDVIEFVKKAVTIGASDIHLNIGEHPAIRRDGKIIKINESEITHENMQNIIETLTPKNIKEKLASIMDIDFAYEIENVARLRVNIGMRLGAHCVTIRIIPYKISTFEELHLPEEVSQFTNLENGLVLVTGPTGSGKSTTLAAILEYINANQQKHIITLEDPIEYIFSDKKSIITQRQLLVDTPTFSEGVKYALRQDPDVILIGEIRDTDTIVNALKASETGHLVFATIHTNNAIQTVNRIINMFPPGDRPAVRNQLAEVLRGTISQKLLPLVNSVGRRPACEVLVITSTIKDLILKNELESIYDLLKKGSFNSMLSMNVSLFNMLKQGLISEKDALAASTNRAELEQMIRGVYHGTSNMQ